MLQLGDRGGFDFDPQLGQKRIIVELFRISQGRFGCAGHEPRLVQRVDQLAAFLKLANAV